MGGRFLEALFAAPSLTCLSAGLLHGAVLAQTIRECPDLSGNLVHDLHIAVVMREHGIGRIHTRDMDFHRFRFLSVLDPVDGSWSKA